MGLERSQRHATRTPPGLNLVHGLLGLPGAPAAPCAGGDFASHVAASNGLPIPFELLVQCSLTGGTSAARAPLLARELRRKVGLLDRDRRIVACLCELAGPESPDDDDIAECVRALDAPSAPLILACDWQQVPRDWPRLPRAEELVLKVPLDAAPRVLEQGLNDWRARLRPGARIVAVVWPSTSAAPVSDAAQATLLDTLTAGADALNLLPLALLGAGDDAAPTARPLHALAARLVTRDWRRLAPALYVPGGRAPQRAPFLLRLTARLPHSDVLGLGPAGRSRINDVGFGNFASFDDYARDVSIGGFGVATMEPLAPTTQFVEELLLSLAGGGTVDVTALARRWRCASPGFLRRCDTVFAELAAGSALSLPAPRRVTVAAADDAGFGDLRQAMFELCADRVADNVALLNGAIL